MTGLQALEIFYNEQKRIFRVSYSFNQMIEAIGPKWFPDSLTTAFELDDNLTTDRIKNAMLKLAYISRGDIPKNYQIFLKALSDEATSLDFKAISEITSNTVNEVKNDYVKPLVGAYVGYKVLAVLAPLAWIAYDYYKKKK